MIGKTELDRMRACAPLLGEPAASEMVRLLDAYDECLVKLIACSESRLAIIEIVIQELDACAAAFEACSRDGRPCGCGTAAKNARALAMRFRAQRPNDGRSKRCGVRTSNDSWCVLDVGHDGEHVGEA